MKLNLKKLFMCTAVLMTAVSFFNCSSDSSGSSENGGSNSGTVTGVSVTPAVLKLIIGDEPVQLTAVVTGDNLSDAAKAVVWESQNPSIASVDQNGKVTAKAKGSTRIVAKSKVNTAVSNHCAVTVDEANSKTVYNFDFSTLGSFSDGTTPLYKTTLEYYNDAVYAYHNASSGTAFRVRTSGGVNTAFNYNGENTTTKDAVVGGTVAEGSYYAGINLNKLTLASDTVKVEISITTNGSDNSKATDSGILYLVNVTTGKVIAIETNLKLTKASGGETRTVTVEVPKTADVRVFFSRNGSGGGIDITSFKVIDDNASATIVRPESISLDKSTASLTMTDSDLSPAVTLTATVLLANVTSGYGTVTWTSSNTAAATVANGVVTAVGAGTATITAATSNGKSASCTVTVTDSRTTKYLLKTDTPVGYANIDLSKMTKSVKVSNRADFKKYATAGGYIVYVDGVIDMTDEGSGSKLLTFNSSTNKVVAPAALDSWVKSKVSTYANYDAWKTAYYNACSLSTEDGDSNSTTKSDLYDDLWTLNRAYGNIIKVNPASNTMIVGLDGAVIKGGAITVSNANNVVIRNLTLQDAVDPFPHHEINSSGGSDGFNAQFDTICIQDSSYNVWLDHCTLKDTMHLEKPDTGVKEKWQVYDGLCDMKTNIYNVTVSYCKFQDHDKTMLIGSSDSDGSNTVRKVNMHHTYFLNCGQRLPMIRNTEYHIFNNVYDTKTPYYSQQYCVGVRKNAKILSENNYFGSITYAFSNNDGIVYDSGSTGVKLNGTVLASDKTFTPPYQYSGVLETAAKAKVNVEANAGAGIWKIPAGETSGL